MKSADVPRQPGQGRSPRAASPWRWNASLLVFVAAALAASVLIPASATSRIIAVFRQLNDIVEPARRVATSLQGGLAAEVAELENYALSADSSSLRRYHVISAGNDRHLASLAVMASQLDAQTAAEVNIVREQLSRWREANRAVPAGSLAPDTPADASRIAAIRASVTALQLRLGNENQQRREQVQAAGRLSLVSNVLLVLAALAAIAGVIVHMLRERQLVAVLRERATREASLRAAAEALAAAFTLEDIAHQIARSAVSVLPAHGAFVLDITSTPVGTRALVVRSTAGSEVPPIGTTCALAGSGAERAIMSEGPVIASVNRADPLMRDVIMIGSSVSALIVRLHDGDVPRGALFVLSASGFDSDDVIWARTLEHVATLAYEKVRLLDAANDGRRKLETVMHSRSRLMRGFSHDVKNPLGAADGFTALMLEGVYGELTSSQQESLQRVRRSINVALGLIDDLNDFARAEAGKVTLTIAPVDVAELARTIGTQYHASAKAKGLTLHVDIAPGLPSVATDASRLRQVMSNLLSNAIKYTDEGSVEMWVTQSVDPYDHLRPGLRIDVTDTGPGIPAAKQALIFDEFSRLHATKQPGAGLGLPISKLLAEMLGGSISVYSNEGVGSTFILWIPAESPGFSEPHQALRAATCESQCS